MSAKITQVSSSLHEILFNHIVPLSTDGEHASLCANVAHVSIVEVIRQLPWDDETSRLGKSGSEKHGPFPLQMSHEKNPYYFPLYWLFNRDSEIPIVRYNKPYNKG